MELADILGRDVIEVKVRTGAGRTQLERIEHGVLRISLKAQPEDGKANAELERFLSKMSGKNAKITSGLTAKLKRVRLSGVRARS